MKYHIQICVLLIIVVVADGLAYSQDTHQKIQFAGQWPFQSSKAIASDAERNLIFLGEGNRIAILNSDLRLIQIFSVTSKGQVGALFYSVSDQLLYAACRNDGFAIIDVSDSENPYKIGDNFASGEFVQISGRTVPLEVNGIYVEGQYAFLACGWAGVKIVEVADPANPSLLVHFLLQGAFGLTYAIDIYSSENYLWISDIYNGIHVFGTQDIEMPKALYAISIAGAHDLTVNDNFLYATTEGNGLYIYDISKPETPVQAGSYKADSSFENAVRVNDTLAYVTATTGVKIVDVTDKTNLYHNPSWKYHDTDAISIELLDETIYSYITDSIIGLQRLDVFDKESIFQTETFDTPADALAIHIQGDYLYSVDNTAGTNPANEGLRILEISTDNGIQFFLKGFCKTPGAASDIFVSGDYAYVADRAMGLQVVNVSDKLNPVITGSYDTPGQAVGLFVIGNNAYVADGDQGFLILNISDKTKPQLTGQYMPGSNIKSVFVSGDYAYLATGEDGFEIINISDSTNPIKAGAYDTPGNAEYVFAEGNTAYVADGNKGFLAIDISDKLNPLITGSYATDGYSRKLSIIGDYAFIADGKSGLVALNLSIPEQPVKTEGWSYDTNGIAHDIHTGYFINEELFAFVGDGAGGIVALNLTYEDTVPNEGQTAGSGGGGCFVQSSVK